MFTLGRITVGFWPEDMNLLRSQRSKMEVCQVRKKIVFVCIFEKQFVIFFAENAKETLLPEDWDHFHVLLEELLHRVPSLGQATLDRLANGVEAFSPDCKWIMGEVPEVSYQNLT